MSGQKTPGQVAFDGYATESHGKSLVTGSQLPVWDVLPADIKAAWEAAAEAVRSVPPGAWPDAG